VSPFLIASDGPLFNSGGLPFHMRVTFHRRPPIPKDSSPRFLHTRNATMTHVITRPIPNSSMKYAVSPVSTVMGVNINWMNMLWLA
jgi:hypothetical protein